MKKILYQREHNLNEVFLRLSLLILNLTCLKSNKDKHNAELGCNPVYVHLIDISTHVLFVDHKFPSEGDYNVTFGVCFCLCCHFSSGLIKICVSFHRCNIYVTKHKPTAIITECLNIFIISVSPLLSVTKCKTLHIKSSCLSSK